MIDTQLQQNKIQFVVEVSLVAIDLYRQLAVEGTAMHLR